MDKKWYMSKTIWVNLIAAVVVVAQLITGKQLATPEEQASVLVIVNIILRVISNGNVTW